MSLAVTFKLGKFANVNVLFLLLSTDFPQLVVSKVEKKPWKGLLYKDLLNGNTSFKLRFDSGT